MNKIHFIAYAIIIMLFSLLFFNQSKKAKVAIVDSQKVVREYEGFKEAQNFYENKLEEMKKNFEAKKAIYETKQNQLKIISNRLSKEDLVIREAEIESLKGVLLRLGEEIEKKSIEEEDKLLQGVYNKINDYLKRYGEKMNFDAIIGTTLSGNILYSSNRVNITDDIIYGLNEEYLNGIKE